MGSEMCIRDRGRSTRGTSPGAARRRREAPIVRVEVVRSRFAFDAYYAGDTLPQTETVHARCAVGGTAESVSLTRAPGERRQPQETP